MNKEEIPLEKIKTISTKLKLNKIYQNMWYDAKVVLKGRLIELIGHIRKKKNLKSIIQVPTLGTG